VHVIPEGMITGLSVDVLEETSRRRGGFRIRLKISCADAAAAAHVNACRQRVTNVY